MGLLLLAAVALAAGLMFLSLGVSIVTGSWTGKTANRPQGYTRLGGLLVAGWSVPIGLAGLYISYLCARDVPPIDWLYGALYAAGLAAPVIAHYALRDWPRYVDIVLRDLEPHLKKYEPHTVELNTKSPACTVILAALAEKRAPAEDAGYREASGAAPYGERVHASAARATRHQVRRAVAYGLLGLTPAVSTLVLEVSAVEMSDFFHWLLWGACALGALAVYVSVYTVRRVRYAADGIERLLLESS